MNTPSMANQTRLRLARRLFGHPALMEFVIAPCLRQCRRGLYHCELSSRYSRATHQQISRSGFDPNLRPRYSTSGELPIRERGGIPAAGHGLGRPGETNLDLRTVRAQAII